MPALYYRNETLFSEIYLEEITRLPEQAELLASLDVLSQFRDYADSASLARQPNTYKVPSGNVINKTTYMIYNLILPNLSTLKVL